MAGIPKINIPAHIQLRLEPYWGDRVQPWQVPVGDMSEVGSRELINAINCYLKGEPNAAISRLAALDEKDLTIAAQALTHVHQQVLACGARFQMERLVQPEGIRDAGEISDAEVEEIKERFMGPQRRKY